ncbi:hypothetical protein PoB_005189000 [Plakobranchus ocellatus]|uniref:Uncharacterized protein n=1 Tax=Plakobranchus ocellatus TaxID=259542 RepID=A0AAV4C198_9GAST|nr:hypothetical protein PoB_005189000 [Plakobranchus ocellatus]
MLYWRRYIQSILALEHSCYTGTGTSMLTGTGTLMLIGTGTPKLHWHRYIHIALAPDTYALLAPIHPGFTGTCIHAILAPVHPSYWHRYTHAYWHRYTHIALAPEHPYCTGTEAAGDSGGGGGGNDGDAPLTLAY